MPESNVSFLGRFPLAVGTFFSVLSDREFAAGVLRLRDGAAGAAPTAAHAAAPLPTGTAAPPTKETNPEAALPLLGPLHPDPRFAHLVPKGIPGYCDADNGPT